MLGKVKELFNELRSGFIVSGSTRATRSIYICLAYSEYPHAATGRAFERDEDPKFEWNEVTKALVYEIHKKDGG